jgi:hypothetical protein
MTDTQSALWPYLYGHRVEWEMMDGQLVVQAVKGTQHTYKGKTVETGFFDLPGAENISAITSPTRGPWRSLTAWESPLASSPLTTITSG